MGTERVLDDFAGRWTIVRDITHADGTRGRFDGAARFEPRGDGLDYVEEGVLRIGQGAPLSAAQRYRWEADLSVYFEDGRFFHHVPPAGGDTAHWCAPDQYDGSYDFAHWPAFEVIWRVRGPRKDYRMRSRYVRSARA